MSPVFGKGSCAIYVLDLLKWLRRDNDGKLIFYREVCGSESEEPVLDRLWTVVTAPRFLMELNSVFFPTGKALPKIFPDR